ncbi:transposable element Tcb1 transposase [Trichonephila clavipes]|uniref:Transposable element Tcb1 transposase n=1 Tax=Trichonephila clavipes TaxID=2585209 RepID=A0A8X7BA05_TRICX|nr:transposable element Tcb1 transposase [Trichonephila clavipes]
MYARPTSTRHGLVVMFENTSHFVDRSSRYGYSCHQIHFRFDGRDVNRGSERSMLHHVAPPSMLHSSERLTIRWSPHWISFPMQSNNITSISIGRAIVEVDIRQLGVRITVHVHRTLSMSEMRKPHVPILNCWEQWTREGTHVRKAGSAATRKTTRREDRRIVRKALVDPTVTRSTIRADVGVAIVPQTISRHLAEANLKSKRPFRALPLTPEHRQLRLQWCQARSLRNVTDWQKVVFSDESQFVLGTDDNHVRVWRPSGERYSPPPKKKKHCSTSHCQHIWCNGLGAIAYDSRSTLIVMRGTLTGQR